MSTRYYAAWCHDGDGWESERYSRPASAIRAAQSVIDDAFRHVVYVWAWSTNGRYLHSIVTRKRVRKFNPYSGRLRPVKATQ